MKSLSYQFLIEYVFTTLPFSEISEDFKHLLRSLARILLELLETVVSLMLCFTLVLLKSAVIMFPYFEKLLRSASQFHSKLSWWDVLTEFLLFTSIVLGFWYRERISSTVKMIQRSISLKSKSVAKLLPHFMYFLTSLLLGIVGRKFILPLTTNATMPIFTLIIPLLGLALLLTNEITLNPQSIPNFIHRFTTTVIFASYHSFATAASTIPFSSRLLKLLPYVKEILIVILLWLQISPSFSKAVYEVVIQPFMSKLSNYIPFSSAILKIQEQDKKLEKSKINVLLSIIPTFNIFTEYQISFIFNCFQDSIVVIFALCSFFLPYPFSIFVINQRKKMKLHQCDSRQGSWLNEKSIDYNHADE